VYIRCCELGPLAKTRCLMRLLVGPCIHFSCITSQWLARSATQFEHVHRHDERPWRWYTLVLSPPWSRFALCKEYVDQWPDWNRSLGSDKSRLTDGSASLNHSSMNSFYEEMSGIIQSTASDRDAQDTQGLFEKHHRYVAIPKQTKHMWIPTPNTLYDL
jgi:hypothetical protein